MRGRHVRDVAGRGPRALVAKPDRVRQLLAIVAIATLLTGCREVRVRTYAQGTTTVPGGNVVAVVRDQHELEVLGIRAPAIRFKREFGVALLMGPHETTGWTQLIESIRANANRVRVVAFERAPVDGGEPSISYRTYTLWIVPRSVYRAGSTIDVVTPEGEPVASTQLR